jgi:trimeric autotransporter adhesin
MALPLTLAVRYSCAALCKQYKEVLVFAAAGGAGTFPLSAQQTSALIEAACSSSSKKRRSRSVSVHWQQLLAMFARADPVQSGRQHGLALRHCATEKLLPEAVAVALQAAQMQLRIHNRASYYLVEKITRLCWPFSNSSSSSSSATGSSLYSAAAGDVANDATAATTAAATAADASTSTSAGAAEELLLADTAAVSSDAPVPVSTAATAPADISSDVVNAELQEQHQYWLLGLLALLRTVRIAAAAAHSEALAAAQPAAAGAGYSSAAAAAARQAAAEPVDSARELHYSVVSAAQGAGDHSFPVQLFADMHADGLCPS